MGPLQRRRALGLSFLVGSGLLAVACLAWSEASLVRGVLSLGCLLMGLILTGFALQMTVWWGKYGLLDAPRRNPGPSPDRSTDR